MGWIRDIKHIAGAAPSFPIFSDPTRIHAERLGVLDRSNLDRQTGLPLTVRAVYVLDPSKTIRLLTAYPASTGRSMPEILRSLDSLLLTDGGTTATPCNWQPGDDVLVDYRLTDREAAAEFGRDGYRVVEVPSEQRRAAARGDGASSDGARRSDDDGDEAKHYLRYTRDPSVREYEPPF